MCEQCEKYKDAIQTLKELNQKNIELISSYQTYVKFLVDTIKCYETLFKPIPKNTK